MKRDAEAARADREKHGIESETAGPMKMREMAKTETCDWCGEVEPAEEMSDSCCKNGCCELRVCRGCKPDAEANAECGR